MGAWEIGPFENDAALDGLQDIKEESLEAWLDAAETEYRQTKYLESDIGSTVIAMSAIIVGFRDSADEVAEKRSWDAFVSKVTRRQTRRLRRLLKITLSGAWRSELYELHNGDPEWKAVGKNILQQLF